MSDDPKTNAELEPEGIEKLFEEQPTEPAAAATQPEAVEPVVPASEPAPKPTKADGSELSEAELAVLFGKGVVGMEDPAAQDQQPAPAAEDPSVAELRKQRTWG